MSTGDFPPGAKYDSNAPYNEDINKSIKVDVCVSVCLSKNFSTVTMSYEKTEEGEVDYSSIPEGAIYSSQFNIEEILNHYKAEIESKLQKYEAMIAKKGWKDFEYKEEYIFVRVMLRSLDGWTLDSQEIVIE